MNLFVYSKICTFMNRKSFKPAYKLLLCLQKDMQITEIHEGSEILLWTHCSNWGQRSDSLDQAPLSWWHGQISSTKAGLLRPSHAVLVIHVTCIQEKETLCLVIGKCCLRKTLNRDQQLRSDKIPHSIFSWLLSNGAGHLPYTYVAAQWKEFHATPWWVCSENWIPLPRGPVCCCQFASHGRTLCIRALTRLCRCLFGRVQLEMKGVLQSSDSLEAITLELGNDYLSKNYFTLE